MFDWKIHKGRVPILIVAGHARKHIRKDKVKPADLNTDTLAKEISKKTDAWLIYTTTIQKDPNWYVNSPFRKRVKEIIKENNINTVYDIHGRKSKHPNLVELLPNKAFLNLHNAPIKSLNVPILPLVDNEQLTLAEDLGRNNIPCVEIEVRTDARYKKGAKHHDTVKLLTRLIKITAN
jgi:hypothetical protein